MTLTKISYQEMLTKLIALADDDGFTLRHGKMVTYKTGYQVATHGYEVKTPIQALEAFERIGFHGGVWYAHGIYFVDYGYRVNTKRKALEIGKNHNQETIYGWKQNTCFECNP